MKSWGIASRSCASSAQGAAVALVAAHDQPASLLAEVDSRSGSRSVGRCALPVDRALPKRLGDEVLVGERDDRDAHAGQAADLGGEHAAGVDHDLGLDRAPLGLHATHARLRGDGVVDVDGGDAGVGEDATAARPGAVGERGGEQRGIEIAVARQVGGAAHAVGAHQREQLSCLLARRSARAAGRRSWPRRPGAAPPARARGCRRGGCRRTAPSRSRASGRARRSSSSSASGRRSSGSWPTRPAEWKVEPLVSSPRSSSTTSRSPSAARW